MSPVVDASSSASPESRADALTAAANAAREGSPVVLPTDTVYGIGCDAFSAEAVAQVLAIKGRGRDKPPPVLVADVRTVDGLARGVRDWARALIQECWPGPLTVVLQAQPTLHWDLGDTEGTVALRMPDDEVALALLSEVGPMAVTSANATGAPAATTVADAASQLGPSVPVYLDGGPRTSNQPSTIVDCTGDWPIVLREGALPVARLREILGAVPLVVPGETGASTTAPPAAAPESNGGEPAGTAGGQSAGAPEGEGVGSIDFADEDPSPYPDPDPAFGLVVDEEDPEVAAAEAARLHAPRHGGGEDDAEFEDEFDPAADVDVEDGSPQGEWHADDADQVRSPTPDWQDHPEASDGTAPAFPTAHADPTDPTEHADPATTPEDSPR